MIMRKITLCLAPALLTGCATIFDGSTNTVAISSNAPGAQYSIANRSGKTVKTGTLPARVPLKGSAGYFQPENYTITLKKPGYEDATADLDTHLNGWYFGNLVLGGLLGMLVVDPLTGAMYEVPDETEIPMRKLEGEAATVAAAAPGNTYTTNMKSLPNNVRWLYQAEKLAVQMNCSSTSYSAQGPGVEFYEAACGANRIAIRCDFGQCAALN
jgi:hypothetical protein